MLADIARPAAGVAVEQRRTVENHRNLGTLRGHFAELVQQKQHRAIADIGQIGLAIGQIDTIQRSIAASVAEQATVTSDIGRNLAEVAAAADTIARDVGALDHSIRDNTSAATSAATAATRLGALARRIETTIAQFRFRSEARRGDQTTGGIEVVVPAAAGAAAGRNGAGRHLTASQRLHT